MSAIKLAEHKITSSDISVIIQGPLYRHHEDGDLAVRCIASIRRFLPQAEIILSTWHHQNTNELDADRIIYSDEPPGLTDANGNTNNILRQLVSTRNGIAVASRAYVLKFRADHVLINSDMTVVRDYSNNVPATQRLFKQPITVTNYFIRNPVQVPMLFHISDLVQFGRREDMLDLWSIPLPEQKNLYLEKMPRFHVLGHFVGYTSLTQVPEQTLMLSWLKKHGLGIHLPHTCYTTYSLFKRWEQLLTTHFHVMNWQRSGIGFPKRFHYSFYTKHANYTEQDLAEVQYALKHPLYFLRYVRLLLNKYITCWVNRSYLRSFASVMAFSLSPGLARRLREYYRARRIPVNKKSEHPIKYV